MLWRRTECQSSSLKLNRLLASFSSALVLWMYENIIFLFFLTCEEWLTKSTVESEEEEEEYFRKWRRRKFVFVPAIESTKEYGQSSFSKRFVFLLWNYIFCQRSIKHSLYVPCPTTFLDLLTIPHWNWIWYFQSIWLIIHRTIDIFTSHYLAQLFFKSSIGRTGFVISHFEKVTTIN